MKSALINVPTIGHTRRNVGVVRETSQQNVRDMMKLDHAAGPIRGVSGQTAHPGDSITSSTRITFSVPTTGTKRIKSLSCGD
jgi:hypothetical protein